MSKQMPVVPAMSKRDLERHADALLERFFPSFRTSGLPVPIHEMFEYHLREHYGVEPGVTDDLGFGEEGVTRPAEPGGRPEVLLKTDVYLDLLEGKPRARFTCAHETTHVTLHLPHIQTQLVRGTAPVLRRQHEMRPFENPEWQANYAAGALLMPTKAVLAVVNDLGALPSAVATTFNVSPQAAEVRLRYLRKAGLITETP